MAKVCLHGVDCQADEVVSLAGLVRAHSGPHENADAVQVVVTEFALQDRGLLLF